MPQDTRHKDAISRALELTGYEEVQTKIRGDLGLSPIQSIPYMWPERAITTQYKTEEFTSVCPKTGLPDYAKIVIDFSPYQHLPELKSLKLYFTSYRNVGIFHEHLVNRILDDFRDVVKPRWVRVSVDMGNRGGILTDCWAEWVNPDAPQGNEPEQFVATTEHGEVTEERPACCAKGEGCTDCV